MENNIDDLKFPSGLSVRRAKTLAKKMARKGNVSHVEALNKQAKANGMNMLWSQAMAQLRETQNGA